MKRPLLATLIEMASHLRELIPGIPRVMENWLVLAVLIMVARTTDLTPLRDGAFRRFLFCLESFGPDEIADVEKKLRDQDMAWYTIVKSHTLSGTKTFAEWHDVFLSIQALVGSDEKGHSDDEVDALVVLVYLTKLMDILDANVRTRAVLSDLLPAPGSFSAGAAAVLEKQRPASEEEQPEPTPIVAQEQKYITFDALPEDHWMVSGILKIGSDENEKTVDLAKPTPRNERPNPKVNIAQAMRRFIDPITRQVTVSLDDMYMLLCNVSDIDYKLGVGDATAQFATQAPAPIKIFPEDDLHWVRDTSRFNGPPMGLRTPLSNLRRGELSQAILEGVRYALAVGTGFGADTALDVDRVAQLAVVGIIGPTTQLSEGETAYDWSKPAFDGKWAARPEPKPAKPAAVKKPVTKPAAKSAAKPAVKKAAKPAAAKPTAGKQPAGEPLSMGTK